MAEGFSVKAVLSAVDRGFTSTMKSALSSVKSLASTVGSGMIMGAGMAAFNKLTVKAVLSAVDRGFTSTMKSALSSVKSLASTVGSGMIMGAGMAAFNKLTGAASGLVKEVDASNAAWKTFSGNMRMLGKSSKEIESVKKELRSFAEQTVYSSSDMASTFAQLEAVGTKNTLSLVKGFGGLAAAAENPQQAMKTLSMQATQMAAKPKVAWEDFKLMGLLLDL